MRWTGRDKREAKGGGALDLEVMVVVLSDTYNMGTNSFINDGTSIYTGFSLRIDGLRIQIDFRLFTRLTWDRLEVVVVGRREERLTWRGVASVVT